ncbi:MAG: phage virion morphogenesis protein [Methanophagales archaeon]|nr:phage virion morphogenesis protein [Methanophagales archaeon]
MDKGDLLKFTGLLNQLRINVMNPEPFLTLAGEAVRNETLRSFELQAEPQHRRPWKPLAPATTARRPKGKRKTSKRYSAKILLDTGRLRGSITIKKSMLPPTVWIGTNIIYARTHQFGDKIRNIDARPFLPTGWTAPLSMRIRRALEAQIKKGGTGRHVR